MTGGRAAWGFAVASDRDKTHPNFVFVEFLLKDFLAFDAELSDLVRRELARHVTTLQLTSELVICAELRSAVLFGSLAAELGR